jgi:iron-sulfur cluster assembly accessory protein
MVWPDQAFMAGGLTPGFNPTPSRLILLHMEQFGLTERAAARIAEIVAADGRQAALRVAVLAGGCSGFQYRFELDETPLDDDLVIERGNAKVLVDPASLDLLAGAELDYTDELMGSHFAVRNPNAKSACGCGTSFSVD